MPVVPSPREYGLNCLNANSIYHSYRGDVSSMNRENPLYESQEIRMEMFADVSDEEEGTLHVNQYTSTDTVATCNYI